MTKLFKKIALGLGVFLGLISPQKSPDLVYYLTRDSRAIYCHVDIENAVNKKISELIRSGDDIRLYLELSLNGEKTHTYYHSIVYDIITEEYGIFRSETETSHTTNNENAALEIFEKFENLEFCEIDQMLKNFDNLFYLESFIGLYPPSEDDLMVLWNYKKPSETAAHRNAREIPF